MRERGAAPFEEVDEAGTVGQAELGMHPGERKSASNQQGALAQRCECPCELDRSVRAAGAAFRAHHRQQHPAAVEPVGEKLLREGLRRERTRGEQRNTEHFNQLGFRAQPAPARRQESGADGQPDQAGGGQIKGERRKEQCCSHVAEGGPHEQSSCHTHSAEKSTASYLHSRTPRRSATTVRHSPFVVPARQTARSGA